MEHEGDPYGIFDSADQPRTRAWTVGWCLFGCCAVAVVGMILSGKLSLV